MALLTTAQKDQIERIFMRRHFATGAYTKTTLRAAVDDADGWADTNAAAYNTALNATFRAAASTPEKTLLLALVCLQRAGILDDVP